MSKRGGYRETVLNGRLCMRARWRSSSISLPAEMVDGQHRVRDRAANLRSLSNT